MRVSHVWVEREGRTSSMARLAILLVKFALIRACVKVGVPHGTLPHFSLQRIFATTSKFCTSVGFTQVRIQTTMPSYSLWHAWITWISKKCLPKQEWAILYYGNCVLNVLSVLEDSLSTYLQYY